MARKIAARRNPAEPAMSARAAAEEAASASAEAAYSRRPSAASRNLSLPGDAQLSPLDDRKLSKKQRELLADRWQGENAARTVSAAVQALAADARKKFGVSGVFSGGQIDGLVVCVPCPSLAFEFLIQQDGFPLGQVFHLLGDYGSNKSSLLFEFYRWFDLLGAFLVFNENESKFSPDLCSSIMGHRSMAECLSFVLNRCKSVQEWQAHTTYWIDRAKQIFTGTKDNPGPGRTVPMLLGVDSVMGKVAEEKLAQIQEDGYASANYAIEANRINDYLKTVPQLLDGWPFSLVLVNHQKPKKDDNGNDVTHFAGGKAIGFQTAVQIETRAFGKFYGADFDGVKVALKCSKNSLGITGRQVVTRMIWWEEDETDPKTGRSRTLQRTVWDWDWSTVHTLLNLKSRPMARLKERGFHLAAPRTSDVDNLAWSKNLGMKEADARPWHEVGAMIYRDPDLVELIRTALAIKRRPVLAGDYLETLRRVSGALP